MIDVKPRPTFRKQSFLRELVETVVLIGLVYTLVNLASVRFFIEGPSMQPNFWAGQFLIVSRVHYLFSEPQRGDIVVFDPPGDDGSPNEPLLIKRLIGLPGEHVEFDNGVITIDGVALVEPYTAQDECRSNCGARAWDLGDNEYLFFGDNRNNSRDLRAFGTITKDRIIGEAVVRYWPPQDWGLVTHYRFPES